MKKSFLFSLLGFVIGCMIFGVYALNVRKAEQAAATPTPVQISEAPKNEPTVQQTTPTPIPSVSTEEEEEDYDYSDVDLSNYKPHKLPKDVEKWTDEEWAWWTEAASNFQDEYSVKFEDNFGDTPTDEVLQVAQNFAEEVCSLLDNNGTLDDIAAGIVDSGDNKRTQMALAMAVHPGVNNFCPWNKKKLN